MIMIRDQYSAPAVQVFRLVAEDVLANSYKDGGDGIITDFAGDFDGQLFNVPAL